MKPPEQRFGRMIFAFADPGGRLHYIFDAWLFGNELNRKSLGSGAFYLMARLGYPQAEGTGHEIDPRNQYDHKEDSGHDTCLRNIAEGEETLCVGDGNRRI